jgi:hypothetical protein
VIDRLCAAHNAFVRHATNERALSQDTVMDFCYLLARMRRWNMSKAQSYREMLSMLQANLAMELSASLMIDFRFDLTECVGTML